MTFFNKYIRPANNSLACCNCRLVISESEKNQRNACPKCGHTMHNMGAGFIAPRQTDQVEWQKVNFLVKHNFTFEFLPA